jgi:hypothetical protein
MQTLKHKSSVVQVKIDRYKQNCSCMSWHFPRFCSAPIGALKRRRGARRGSICPFILGRKVKNTIYPRPNVIDYCSSRLKFRTVNNTHGGQKAPCTSGSPWYLNIVRSPVTGGSQPELRSATCKTPSTVHTATNRRIIASVFVLALFFINEESYALPPVKTHLVNVF